MRDEKIAHFEKVRLQNRKVIRNLMREVDQLGKSELAKKTGLSYPTVSGILDELVQLGEVEVMEEVVSNGGRPGELFRLNREFQHAVCAYIRGEHISIVVQDIKGDVVEQFEQTIDIDFDLGRLLEILSTLKRRYPQIRAVALGVPGIIKEGIVVHLPCLPKLEGMNIETYLTQHLEVQVFIENDINAIAYAEREQWEDFCHVFLDKGCIGAAIVLGGQLVRGIHGAAGELEWVCRKQKVGYRYLAQSIAILMSVLDVPEIALSGEEVQKLDLLTLLNEVGEILPPTRLPRLHKIENEEQLYRKGLWQMILDYWKEQL